MSWRGVGGSCARAKYRKVLRSWCSPSSSPGFVESPPDTPPDPYDRPIQSMMTISRAARPRTSWVRSATRSQLGRSRLCPASGHNLDGGPEIRGSVSGNLWNSKRVIVSFVRWRDPVRASVRQPKKSVVYMAQSISTSESSRSRGP